MSARTIAIGDIHGCSIALAALIDAIDLQPDDTLVTLGDYVDKGVDSKAVLDFLIKLETRCQLISLIGNHDAVMLGAIDYQLSIEEWKSIGGTATLQSYGESERVADIPVTHAKFLRSCRLWHETSTHLFVHAAYDPERSLEEQDEATLLWQGIRDDVPGPHVSGKTAIVGHTSQKNGEIFDAGHLVCIDTNCWNGGWLTAMDVQSRRVWQVNEGGRLR
ncbi:MAG: serine/threonine protein phosphatase [Planctomycetaceae bacterium]|nr:serine/threonine protein phosphatase [Planctomycetaceae bacterium]MCB9940175.1 serine/threonine protein phosphatase [Planctomycetaceae bacterium]